MKLVYFSLFPPYWEKLKTFPGDTKVHITWSLRDTIQKITLKEFIGSEKEGERK